MKIGIMGGTFNPIHNMHLRMAQEAMETLALDKVLFMVSSVPPHKIGKAIAPGEERLEMVRLAIGDTPGFEPSRLELDREGRSYTLLTLQELHRIYPDGELYFIIGGDSLTQLHTWYRAKEFIPLCTFVVFARDQVDKEAAEDCCQRLREEYGGRLVLMDAPLWEISSTQIRALAAKGAPLCEFVPPAVEDYIHKKGLYKQKEESGHDDI